MGTSFILNFRKKKSEYSKPDELSIRVRYYSDWIKDGRTLSVTTGVKCNLKD